jgi:GAF domain-containing protein
MRGYPLPENETERLAKLRGYEILDSLPEAAYDRITRLAARMFNVPTVLISLIEDERQWFKAKIGIDVQEVPRKISFCAHTICQNDIFVIENAEQDRTFSCSPFVTGEAHLRFYAGAPLRTPDGMNVGTLAIIDKEPRAFGEDDKQVLADLAAMVIDTLEMRLLIDKAERAERRLVDAMESLPSGFVLYDQDDRLVLCNQRYRELYAKSASAIVPGAPFEEIIRKGSNWVSIPMPPETRTPGLQNGWKCIETREIRSNNIYLMTAGSESRSAAPAKEAGSGSGSTSPR